MLIEKEEIDEASDPTKGFVDATAIPRTRSFHQFNPHGGRKIALK